MAVLLPTASASGRCRLTDENSGQYHFDCSLSNVAELPYLFRDSFIK